MTKKATTTLMWTYRVKENQQNYGESRFFCGFGASRGRIWRELKGIKLTPSRSFPSCPEPWNFIGKPKKLTKQLLQIICTWWTWSLRHPSRKKKAPISVRQRPCFVSSILLVSNAIFFQIWHSHFLSSFFLSRLGGWWFPFPSRLIFLSCSYISLCEVIDAQVNATDMIRPTSRELARSPHRLSLRKTQ